MFVLILNLEINATIRFTSKQRKVIKKYRGKIRNSVEYYNKFTRRRIGE